MREGLPDDGALRCDAAAMGVELDAAQAARVLEFGVRLLHWNRAFNLVSRKDQDRLYHRHLLDSLSVLPWLSGGRIMDLGTGAGLPGVPLAIASPTRSFTLVDRSERKIRFVRQTARALGLENVEAVCGDVVALAAADGFVAFDTVVSRAVAGAAEAWRLARTSVAGGGRLLMMAHAQRGARSGLEDEAVAADARIAAHAALAIPGLQFRHKVLVIERAAVAPSDSIDN